MDGSGVLLLLFVPAVLASMSSQEDEQDLPQPQISRRFMRLVQQDPRRRLLSPTKSGDAIRKLDRFINPYDRAQDDTLTVEVAPPFRPKSIKPMGSMKQANQSRVEEVGELIKEVLVQLGKEFMMRQVNEDFVFGQYVGNSMRNLTSDLKLKMQHDILELVIRYQKMNAQNMTVKEEKSGNATEDRWSDFNDLAKIVGG